MEIKQYAVHWVDLNPEKGNEVRKARPCVIVSPDEMNLYIKTVTIAPLTHTLKEYPSRVVCDVKGQKGSVMLDQIRTVDKSRIGSKLAQLAPKEITEIKYVINQMLC
ncbi:MAG: type II toxin-antitoxin system PemK/MazF family toxin [Pedobacter sp.]|nr:MAG: type II toxin-antitoxin system PemK/MazF family toxin [Pedobacter sp.]